jgi:hypothetical protein
MRKLSKTEIADLEFDADLMGYRVVYLPKPLDENHFVLYRKEPVLTHIGHYRNLIKVRQAMQDNYVSPS